MSTQDNPAMDIWLYDIEVFAKDWIVIFHQLSTGHKKVIHNSNYAVAQWLEDGPFQSKPPVLGGYNTKHYDQWILKAIYHGADNATVKELNDFIIAGNEGWNFPWLSHKSTPWVNFDLMDDIPVPLRLKEIEGNLGMSIEESSVSFDIDRALTEAELEEVIRYCSHDVDATAQLYKVRTPYLLSKIAVGAMKGLSAAESLHLTNAKLTAEYLGAVYYDRQDETVYEFPFNLEIAKYTEVLTFFSEVDPLYKRNLDLIIAGVPHTIAWGGLHGALACFSERSTDTRKVMHIDVTSYYPSLMIMNEYLSRSAPHPEEYRQVYHRRIEAKKAGDKTTADALKLVLNTTYGAMKNPYNKLYDPRMANAVCISGQLYLIDLIEKLEPVESFRLIQSNTDGLIVSCDTAQLPALREIVGEWERRTGFGMHLDEVDTIVQKDVNNYVLRDANGQIDPNDGIKGAYVTNYSGGDFANRSLVVVARAVVAALLDNTPPAETIGQCNDLLDFQMICKAGRTYDKVIWTTEAGEVDVQMTNRVYATEDPAAGTLYKVKLAREEQPERRDKIANLPDHCIIDNTNTCRIEEIDKQFYIDMATKRINDYLGIEVPKAQKPKKERKKRMSTRTRQTDSAATPPNEAQESAIVSQGRPGLYQKLFKLQELMDGYAWSKDGKNRHQSYEYITERQYKNNFKAARAAASLLWKMEEIGHEYLGTISDKMHLILTSFRGRLIDPETGEYEEYLFSGSGADNGDKALYKAYTGGLKFFLASNYLVAEGNDPENDEAETRAEKPKFTSPDRREDIRDKVTDQGTPATEEQLEAIALGISMLEEAKVDTAPFVEMLGAELTKADAEQLLDAISQLLPESAA